MTPVSIVHRFITLVNCLIVIRLKDVRKNKMQIHLADHCTLYILFIIYLANLFHNCRGDILPTSPPPSENRENLSDSPMIEAAISASTPKRPGRPSGHYAPLRSANESFETNEDLSRSRSRLGSPVSRLKYSRAYLLSLNRLIRDVSLIRQPRHSDKKVRNGILQCYRICTRCSGNILGNEIVRINEVSLYCEGCILKSDMIWCTV